MGLKCIHANATHSRLRAASNQRAQFVVFKNSESLIVHLF
jgi:hypothetical protein